MSMPTAPTLGSPAGRLAGTRVAVIIEGLLVYDDLWTAELTAAGAGNQPLSQDDLDAIRSLVGEIDQGVRSLSDPLYELRLMFEGADEDVLEASLAQLAESGLVSRDLPSEVSELLGGDLRGSFIGACSYVLEHSGEETERLYRELAAVEQGEASLGDFGTPFWCSLAVVITGAAVAVTAATGGGALILAGGIGAKVGAGVLSLKGLRCLNWLPNLRSGH
jgi:hypothetical protein